MADKARLPASGGLPFDEWVERPHAMVSLRPDALDEIGAAIAAQGRRRHIALVFPHWSAAVNTVPGADLVLTIASRAVGPMNKHKTLRKFPRR